MGCVGTGLCWIGLDWRLNLKFLPMACAVRHRVSICFPLPSHGGFTMTKLCAARAEQRIACLAWTPASGTHPACSLSRLDQGTARQLQKGVGKKAKSETAWLSKESQAREYSEEVQESVTPGNGCDLSVCLPKDLGSHGQ